MFSKVKKIAITAMLSIGVLATIPVTADAHRRHNSGNGVGIEFYFGGSNGHSHWRRDRRHNPHWGHGKRWKKRHGVVRRCSVKRALNKAYRMGVNNPRVRRANQNVIKIKGRSRGHRVRIVFSRAPGCPVIRY